METVWFALWGVLWALYFILDGFDLGLGILQPILAKNEDDVAEIHSSIAPFWDGNEVWLISAGGITFAAFPKVYAVMFSALYAPLLILLFALIFRAVSMEFRNLVSCSCWKKTWDAILCVSSLIPPLILGVAFANLFMGIPVDDKGIFHGTICDLLNPYGLIGGITFVLLFCRQGALWLAMRTSGDLKKRSISLANILWFFSFLAIFSFIITTTVCTKVIDQYLSHPLLFIIPIVLVCCIVFDQNFKESGRTAWQFAMNTIVIVCIAVFGLVGIFPNMILSSLNPAWSINAYNGCSSPLTLRIMLVVVITALPFVLGYQLWMYKIFSPNINKH